MFFIRRRRESRRRAGILASAERELRELLQPFPRVSVKVRHYKNQSTFLIDQKRGEDKCDLLSFVWMEIHWEPEEEVVYSIRGEAPGIPTSGTDRVHDAIGKIVEFLRKYNSPAPTIEIGE